MGPSEAAVKAAAQAAEDLADGRLRTDEQAVEAARDVLTPAHDPALGLDRSVCLREVVEFIRGFDEDDDGERCVSAEVLEREFGGGS